MPDSSTPFDTQPFRPPPLQQRISGLLNYLLGRAPSPQANAPTIKGEPEPAPQQVTQNDPAGRAVADANYAYSDALYRNYLTNMQATANRRRLYAEYDAMDNGQIEALLDSIVDSCLVSDDGKLRGISIDANPKYRNVLEQTISDINLQFELRDILRDMLKYGDKFVGYIFDENYNIVGLDLPPASQMWAFVDQHMRLLTGTENVVVADKMVAMPRAYQQKNDALSTVAAWHPFEMTHLKYKTSRNKIYAERSFLEGLRNDWYKIQLIEESLALHRTMRSTPRVVHTIDVTGKDDQSAQGALKTYVDSLRQEQLSNGQVVEKQLSVKEDLFNTNSYHKGADKLYPGLNGVQFFDPRNTGLQTLPDVEYFTKKQFARVPAESVGILPDRQDISTQDIAASRFYAYLQYILEMQLLRPMFNLALLLRGYKPKPYSFRPEENDYRIIFPNVQLRTSWRFADAQFRQSLADANDVETGINNRKNISKDKYNWTDADWDDHVQQFEKEKDVFLPPDPAPAVGKNVGAKSGKVNQIRKGQNST